MIKFEDLLDCDKTKVKTYKKKTNIPFLGLTNIDQQN